MFTLPRIVFQGKDVINDYLCLPEKDKKMERVNGTLVYPHGHRGLPIELNIAIQNVCESAGRYNRNADRVIPEDEAIDIFDHLCSFTGSYIFTNWDENIRFSYEGSAPGGLYSKSLIIRAISSGSLKMVCHILNKIKKHRGDMYVRRGYDYFLQKAAEYGKLELVKYFMSLGGEISYNNYACFRYTVIGGFSCRYSIPNRNVIDWDNLRKVLDFLLENGVDINVCNGDTLIHSAADGKNMNGVKYLLERGANINIRDGQVLISAISEENKDLDMLKFLLGNGADLDRVHNRLIIECIKKDRYGALAYLVDEAGANLEAIKPILESDKDTKLVTNDNKNVIREFFRSRKILLTLLDDSSVKQNSCEKTTFRQRPFLDDDETALIEITKLTRAKDKIKEFAMKKSIHSMTANDVISLVDRRIQNLKGEGGDAAYDEDEIITERTYLSDARNEIIQSMKDDDVDLIELLRLVNRRIRYLYRQM